jgi:hypothetical protein
VSVVLEEARALAPVGCGEAGCEAREERKHWRSAIENLSAPPNGLF